MRNLMLTSALCAAACVSVGSATMCTRPIDLVMILDESGSVSNTEWQEARTFMGQIAARYNVGQGATDTRISVVPFSRSNQQKTAIKFNQGTSNDKIAQLISGMPRSYWSGTCTGISMKYTDENVIASSGVSISNGYRNGPGTNNEVSTVVVFLTDGNPSSTYYCGTSSASRSTYLNNLKGKASRVIPVGIGGGISTSFLQLLSSNMPAGMPYISASYSNLGAVLDDLAAAACPTGAPTTGFPTAFPTAYPTSFPTALPSGAPTKMPTKTPTKTPTAFPTTKMPTGSPTSQGGCTADEISACAPTNSLCSCGDATCSFKACGCLKGFACNIGCTQCTVAPTRAPTTFPTASPTAIPTSYPTQAPTRIPTTFPTAIPTKTPTKNPTFAPSGVPTALPSKAPTFAPSSVPTRIPTVQPSRAPSTAPTKQPSFTPTQVPTATPTKVPTFEPTVGPTFSALCDAAQTNTCDTTQGICSVDLNGGVHCECKAGYGCSNAACGTCTSAPSHAPTAQPSSAPTKIPTTEPTGAPTSIPTTAPSQVPSSTPSQKPTYMPTALPTFSPTKMPTFSPTSAPSSAPTPEPTEAPSSAPSPEPTEAPSTKPSVAPSLAPTFEPTMDPTFAFGCSSTELALCDSENGICFCANSACTKKQCGCAGGRACATVDCTTCTARPTLAPTIDPTAAPSGAPTVMPSGEPTGIPTPEPTAGPSDAPTSEPTTNPTEAPVEMTWPAGQAAIDGLSTEEKAGVAAGIGGLALALLIVGIVVAVVVVLAILAATTGIFIAHKKMHTLDNHAFEGELVEMSAIPMGSVIENPEHSDMMVSPAWRDRFDGGGGFGSDANDVTIGSDASGRC